MREVVAFVTDEKTIVSQTSVSAYPPGSLRVAEEYLFVYFRIGEGVAREVFPDTGS
jgi:hypothetical protein